MSTKTKNYELVKPELTDTADITAMNENWDKVDNELFDRARAPFFATVTGNYRDGYQIDTTFDDIMTAYAESREMLIFDAASSVRLFRFVKASASNVYFAYNNGEDAVSLVVSRDNVVTVTSISFLKENHANDVTAHSDIRDLALDAETVANSAKSDAENALAKVNSHTHDVADVTGTLPISKGGTGSTSATAALTNLGAAKKTHNHTATDINSGTLSSDRLPVIPITKGGTGASNSSQARANLGIAEEYWTFTLEDGTTVTKLVCAT